MIMFRQYRHISHPISRLSFVLLLLLVLVSCREDVTSSKGATRHLSLDVSVVNMLPVTRTAVIPLQGADGTVLYLHQEERSVAPVTRGAIREQGYFYDQLLVTGFFDDNSRVVNDEGWTTVSRATAWNTGIEWPQREDATMQFYAVAPAELSGMVWTGDEDYTQQPTFTFTPSTVDHQQTDLLYGRNLIPVSAYYSDLASSDPPVVPLTMNHVLTAIQFAVGDLAVPTTITDITLSGVYGVGTFSNGVMQPSADAEPLASYSFTNITGDKPRTWDGLEINRMISGVNEILFLIPQILPEGALLSVTLNGVPYTADLSGTVWMPGTVKTYKLSTRGEADEDDREEDYEVSDADYTLLVQSPATYTNKGGTNQYVVQSYKNDTEAAVEWEVTAYWDADNKRWVADKPASLNWLTMDTEGNGGKVGERKNVTVAAQTGTAGRSHQANLRSARVRGTDEKPWDLSTHNRHGDVTLQNTANCYVIGARGVYSFPLVYGCAITNGIDKIEELSKSGTRYDDGTVAHNTGTVIKQAYIYEEVYEWAPVEKKTNISAAKLLWQDVDGMIANVRLSDDKHSVVFDVTDAIAQGNALIVAMDGDQIAWSWHIWVTDVDIDHTANGVLGYEAGGVYSPESAYDFMPVNLGWTSYEDEYFSCPPREALIEITQKESGNKAKVVIRQDDIDGAMKGNSPYFQWSRPNPLPIGKTLYGDKTLYGGDVVAVTVREITDKKEAIMHPEAMCYINGDKTKWGCANTGNWGGTWNTSSLTKTLSDPSPVGFRIPVTHCFTGLSTTGTNYNWSYEDGFPNAKTIVAGEGVEFYCKPRNYTNYADYGTFYMPATGYLRISEAVEPEFVDLKEGYYWSADVYDGNCHYIRFDTSSQIEVYLKRNETDGLCLRPVRDK